MITSRRHPKITKARRLLEPETRRKEGLFLVEGLRLLEEAFASGLRCESFFYTDNLRTRPRGRTLLDAAVKQSAGTHQISESLLGFLKETKTPQGAVGVFRQPDRSKAWESPLRSGTVVTACGVGDPGNLGTIFRVAEAAGARGVLLARGTVDPYHAKAVRASMGSLFRLPVMVMDDLEDRLTAERASGVQVAAAVSRGGLSPGAVDLTRPTYLVLGGETQGLSETLLASATHRITIPMAPPVESLNVAMTAAILLYEGVRQRGGLPAGPGQTG